MGVKLQRSFGAWIHFFSTLMKINTHMKKTMLSEASSVFDPLGWLAPVGIRIKIMFKVLWLQNLSYELLENAVTVWMIFRDELASNLILISVPRWLTEDKAEFHGFSDASKLASSATIYVHTITLPKWVDFLNICNVSSLSWRISIKGGLVKLIETKFKNHLSFSLVPSARWKVVKWIKLYFHIFKCTILTQSYIKYRWK